MDREQAINIALKEGAYKAAVIPVEQVVLSAHFRDICATNSCGRYGTCWMCPPDVGPVEELMAQIGQFTHGLIYQTVTELEDSFDIEGMSEAEREALIYPIEHIFKDKRKVTLAPFFARLARCGVEIYLKKIGVKAECGEQIALYDESGFFALGEVREFDDGIAIKPIKQFEV